MTTIQITDEDKKRFDEGREVNKIRQHDMVHALLNAWDHLTDDQQVAAIRGTLEPAPAPTTTD